MNSIKTIKKPQIQIFWLRFLQVLSFMSLNLFADISQSLDYCDLNPYGGLEYVHRDLGFQKGYGKGDFKKHIPQANVFLGIHFNSYLGLEAGYLLSQALRRTSLAIGGRRSLGAMLDEGEYIVSENKLHVYGPHINLLGHLALRPCGFSLIGSVGVSSLVLKASYKPIADEQALLSSFEAIEAKRTFSLKTWVPTMMVGLGYQCTDCIGLRVLMGYERMKQGKKIVSKEVSAIKIAIKNSFLCSLGLIAKF